MTSFQVDPQDLDGYAGLLARAAGDARECRAYFDRHVPELHPVTGGIINPLGYEHSRVRSQLAAMLGHLATVLDASQEGMRAAADRYRDSDRATAARLDDSYPAAPRPGPRTS
jgi:hypothetical protein